MLVKSDLGILHVEWLCLFVCISVSLCLCLCNYFFLTYSTGFNKKKSSTRFSKCRWILYIMDDDDNDDDNDNDDNDNEKAILSYDFYYYAIDIQVLDNA